MRWPLHKVSPSGGGGGWQTWLALQLQPVWQVPHATVVQPSNTVPQFLPCAAQLVVGVHGVTHTWLVQVWPDEQLPQAYVQPPALKVPQAPLHAPVGSQPPPSSMGGRIPALAGRVNATRIESTSRCPRELHRLGTGPPLRRKMRGIYS
jgi:hypothetical protein